MKTLNIFLFIFAIHSMQAAEQNTALINPRPDLLNMEIERFDVGTISGGPCQIIEKLVFSPKNDHYNEGIAQAAAIWKEIVEKPHNLQKLKQMPAYLEQSALVQKALQYHWYMFAIASNYCICAEDDFKVMQNNAVWLLPKHFIGNILLGKNL